MKLSTLAKGIVVVGEGLPGPDPTLVSIGFKDSVTLNKIGLKKLFKHRFNNELAQNLVLKYAKRTAHKIKSDT